MLIVIGPSLAAVPVYRIAVFFARIVIPFSRSRSPESIARSSTCWCSPNAPDCQSIASTRVVLPWSTWATIATLRRSALMAGMALQGSDPLPFHLKGRIAVDPAKQCQRPVSLPEQHPRGMQHDSEENRNAYRHREVVQRRQGLWLHQP